MPVSLVDPPILVFISSPEKTIQGILNGEVHMVSEAPVKCHIFDCLSYTPPQLKETALACGDNLKPHFKETANAEACVVGIVKEILENLKI